MTDYYLEWGLEQVHCARGIRWRMSQAEVYAFCVYRVKQLFIQYYANRMD